MPQKYGDKANEEVKTVNPCLVCDDPAPRYSWTDYSGEGYCLKCGTPYQLKWGEPKEGQAYPYCKIKPTAIPLLRKYWAETQRGNGLGTFMSFGAYPDQLEGRKSFNQWCAANKDEIAKIPTAE